MRKIGFLFGALSVLLLSGCGKTELDYESYLAEVLVFEEMASPSDLWDIDTIDKSADLQNVSLESLLISYSDMSLRLQDLDLLLDELESSREYKDIYIAMQEYFDYVQSVYQWDLHKYVMDLAQFLQWRAWDEISVDQLFDEQNRLFTNLDRAWWVFHVVYEKFLQES